VTLSLEITSPQPASGAASRQTFHEDGGSIGREIDNSWVLPHSKVSGHHALISYRNAVYYIEDRSRNGVCLNSSNNRLERGRAYALKSGDRILIDPYEIRVSIARDQNDAAERQFGGLSDIQSSDALLDASNPFDSDDPFAPLAPRPMASSGYVETPAEEIAGQALDPLELLGLGPTRAPVRKAASARDLDGGLGLDAHYQPPAVMSAPASAPPANSMAIPQGYDPLAMDDAPSISRPSSPEPPPRERAVDRLREEQARRLASPPAQVSSPASASLPASASPPVYASPPPSARVPAYTSPPAHTSPPAQMPPPIENSPPIAEGQPVATTNAPHGDADFAAVLAGAGLDPANVTPEIARDFGQILRVVVSGVMDVMRSRQAIKDEFRMRMTRVRSIENNPLKFSANVDDALHNLLVKRNRAYLPAVEAFEDAFADLRHHQIAMLAGMRVAFESMLAEFDPDRLQEEFDRQLSKSLVPAKLRYWDLFREKRQEIVKDPEASFRQLFGEEFARAYEDQLTQLRAQERGPGAAPARTPKPPDP
jgi:predicted component of type VI protein secretion system